MSKSDHLAAAEQANIDEAKNFISAVKRQLAEPSGTSTSFELEIHVPKLSSPEDIREAIRLCKKDGWDDVELKDLGDGIRYILCKP